MRTCTPECKRLWSVPAKLPLCERKCSRNKSISLRILQNLEKGKETLNNVVFFFFEFFCGTDCLSPRVPAELAAVTDLMTMGVSNVDKEAQQPVNVQLFASDPKQSKRCMHFPNDRRFSSLQY